MLRFSDEQLREFSRHPFDAFKVSLVDWLERHEPTAGPPLRRATLEQMVATGIARAKWVGLEEHAALAGFVAIMFALSPNFDEHPTLRQLLEDRSMTEWKRIDRIGAAPRSLRIEVAGQSRLSAWFD